MRVSVIIPCYNVEDRVRDCLDSVLKQSIGLVEMEIIIVDDASTDNTVSILREYEQKYSDNIALILCDENGRQGKARNIGLEYASGDWISFVDADDQIHHMMYDVVCGIGEKENAEMVCFKYSSDDLILEDYIEFDNMCYHVFDLLKIEDRKKFVIRGDLINNSCTQKIYRRDFLEKAKTKYAEGVCYEEPLFTYPLRFEANRIAIIDMPLYYYHLNPEGTINQTMSDPSTILDHISVQLQLFEYMRKQEYYLDYKNEIELNFLHCFVYEPYIFLKNRGFEMPESLYERIRDLKNRMVPDWKENPYLEQIPKEEREYISEKSLRIDFWLGIGSHGGVESVINRTALYMVKKGIRVRVIQLIRIASQWIDSEIPFYSLIDGPLSSWDNVYDKYMEFYLEHGCPDLVLTETWPVLNLFARRLIIEGGMSFKIVSRIHDTIESYETSGVGGMNDLQYADVHLVLNNSIMRQIIDALPESIVYRVNNPIKKEIVEYNEDRDIHELAYVGRFSKEKNIPLIIQVLSELPNKWRLTLVGEGPENETINESIEKFGVRERVRLYSWLERPWEELKRIGIVIISSENEVGPLVAIEALACGIMVLSRPVGIMPDVITEGRNGYLFDNSSQLKSLLIDLDNETKEIPVPKACRESIDSFIGDKYLEEMVSIIKKVIDN